MTLRSREIALRTRWGLTPSVESLHLRQHPAAHPHGEFKMQGKQTREYEVLGATDEMRG